MAERADIERYRQNLQDEVDGAAMYRALADIEEEPALVELYERLAATEERHGGLWKEKLVEAGEDPGEVAVSRRARMLIWLSAKMGTGVLVSTIARDERSGQFMYDDQPETEGTSLRADERSHARIMATLAEDNPTSMTGPVLARLEGRHSAVGGNALRAAVLGANDGLVSNLALVMGIAGATNDRTAVLLAGLAGLLAGAISMALGEWISVQSSRELNKRQIATERSEIEEFPEEEAEELTLIYMAKGIPADQAAELAASVMADTERALDTMAREELGIDPDDLGGSAWEAAITSFFLFSMGAILPVLPFFFTSGATAIAISMLLSGIGLFALGAAISLMTGRNVWFSGFRQMSFGLVAAVITFGIGSLLGVAVA
ncbi:MAG: VIT1/CCC1 transporter family protein [Actinomycetia bacterium]|nr:VIT1/CCC1 transporter family protein [Actinomycetes bacterium]